MMTRNDWWILYWACIVLELVSWAINAPIGAPIFAVLAISFGLLALRKGK